VVNARDAMPGGGLMTIELSEIELDEETASAQFDTAPGRYVVLTITDTGTGMSPEVKEHLFEPFFTTKEAGKGTGLGLATVHGIAGRAGGRVKVYSELGMGTSFRVYLPAAAGEVQEESAPPAALPRSGGETVLVVEDAEPLRRLTAKLLERRGYRVLTAASAAEAVEIFERGLPIDVLLTDVVMPGATGPELTQRLLERHPRLRVVYMSGYTEEAIHQHGILRPGVAFLQKPFSSESLERKIREQLER
jgi:CheY-like chemotaxis protein